MSVNVLIKIWHMHIRGFVQDFLDAANRQAKNVENIILSMISKSFVTFPRQIRARLYYKSCN